MDFEQALRLLQELHRHIEALEEMSFAHKPEAEHGYMALYQARAQADQVIEHMLSAGIPQPICRPEGLNLGQAPHLFGQPETAK